MRTAFADTYKMENASVKFSNLFQFFGAYFHQDWMIEDPTAEAVVERFLKENPPDFIQNVLSELDSFLSNPWTEDELRRIVDKEFCCYYYLEDGASMRAWLIHLRGLLNG